MKPIKNGDTCTFQILFTSDVHGAFRDYNYSADKETPTTGFSKMATLMRRDRDSFEGTTFVVDIGDIIQGNGTNAFIKNKNFRPYPLLAAYDAFGYDIVSIGNHEFNYGIPALLEVFQGFQGEKLCGNVFDENQQLLDGFNAYTIKTLENGLRIAFIGMVSPNVDKWDKENFKKANFHSTNAAVETQKIIRHLKCEQLADVMIVLGHMHLDNELDREGSGANDIVKLNPEIDLFLGAHFHLAVGTKAQQCILNNAVKFAENKASAATYGKALITAHFENGRWAVKNKVGSYEESDVKTDIIEIQNDDAIIQATTDAHEFLVNHMRNTIVGTLAGEQPLVPSPSIKGTHEALLQPTALISLFTSIIQKYTKADIVATSVNDFSVNCLPGPISLGRVAQMYVYDTNTFYLMEMTGRQVLKWMEWSYAYFGATENGIPNLSGPAVNLSTDLTIPYGTRKIYLHDKFGGVRYEVDLTKKVGERIHNVTMADGCPLELDTVYKIAASNYRATTNLLINSTNGIFPEGEETATLLEMDLKSPEGNTNMLEWIAEYIQEQPNATITNDFQPNWKFINLDWDEELRAKAIEMINTGELSYDFKVPVKKENL